MPGLRDAPSIVVTSTQLVRRLLLVCSIATTVRAQSLVAGTAARPYAPRPDAPRPDAPRWHPSHCLVGLTYGAPQKLAVSWAGGMLREGAGEGAGDSCAFVAAKLGVGGVRTSLGFGRSLGHLGGGVALSADLLRTFASPLGASARRTYVGVTLHLLPLLALGGELGYFVRLGDATGASRDQRRVVTWSTGFGF